MINIINYNEKYKEKVFEFIYNTMSEELDVDKTTLEKITKDLKNIQKNYINKNGTMFLAIDYETDNVVGTIAIIESQKGIGELKRFYIKKEYRSQKIGYKLYSLVEDYAINKSFKRMYLVSGKELTKAHKLYERNGWEKVINNGEVNIYVRQNANLYKKELMTDYKLRFAERLLEESNQVFPRKCA